MRLFYGITETRKAELIKQLRAVWTHDSTAIEGNTLSLGDTMFVLEYGLTVKGKPLKTLVRAAWESSLALVFDARNCPDSVAQNVTVDIMRS